MEETQDYDKLYSKIKENYIIELNNELADELYDANDEDYVEQKFKEKYHKKHIHYSAFIFNNTRRGDLFKSDLLHKFEDIFRRIKTNPMNVFVKEILPEIIIKYKKLYDTPLKKDEVPIFDYDFFNDSNTNSIVEYIAIHFALEKILTTVKSNNTDNYGIGNLLNKLNQTQRALFFVYIYEAECITAFEDYGTGKINGMKNLFNQYNLTGSFDAFKNKYNSFEKREKRLSKLQKDDLIAVIPLLIACPIAYNKAQKELEHIEQFT